MAVSMLEIIPLAFLSGSLAKIADMYADGLSIGSRVSYIIGGIYGFLLSYMMASFPVLSPLVIAVVLGVLLAGKIDSPVHYTGIGCMIIFSIIMGIGPVDVILVLFFLSMSAADEIGNDIVDRKRLSGVLAVFFRMRLTMEVGTFMISLLTGEWLFFISMVAADAGYTYMFAWTPVRKLLRVSGQ